ncbi:unnamed protein product, partial [marine sediment metagenome]
MNELDPNVHQPTRLRILMLLSGVDSVDFKFLRATLSLSNGNLSAHTRRLEEAGYITVSKTFEGRMPRTTYSLTGVGREQLDEYWGIMDEIR